MMEIILRLIVLLSCLFGCVYGICVIQRHFNTSFFKIALCGVFALFLARLFYFVLTISGGDDTSFSIGVFGQSAAYMFFIIADLKYVPPEVGERFDRRISRPALAVAAVPCILLAGSALTSGTPGAFIGEGLYIVTMGPTSYYCVRSIINRHNNPFRKQITPYYLCICILIYANAFSEAINVTNIEAVVAVSKFALTFISASTLSVMLPLLRRGLRPWEV